MAGDDPPAEVVAQPDGGLLKYLAIGRLATNAAGELLPDKHRLVAHNFARKEDPDPDWAKQVKSHIKAVMKRAGHKLTPGKRIRLKDDNAQYEVHILTDEQEGDKNKTLVFFAVTAIDFPKYHSVPSLLRDIKGGFYQTVDAGTLWNGGSVQRACQPYFQRLMNHYGTSPLLQVQVKVEAVKEVMASSVAKALTTVEGLEEMDEKAELFEDQSKKFHKKSVKVKEQEKSKCRQVTAILVLLVVGIVAYFVVTTVQHYRNSSSTDDPVVVADSSSTADFFFSSSSSSSSTGSDSSTGSGSTGSDSSTGSSVILSSTGDAAATDPTSTGS